MVEKLKSAYDVFIANAFKILMTLCNIFQIFF